MSNAFQKLNSFGQWAGLEINPRKSAYTNNLTLIRKHRKPPVNLPVMERNEDGTTSISQVTKIAHDTPYKYMGTLLRMDLNWTDQMTLLERKLKNFQNMLRGKKLTADQKVIASNAVSNSYVAYSMAVIHYDRPWLEKLDKYTATTINKAMGLRANANHKPLFLDVIRGGKGLVSLVDLQDAITCSQTITEMNSNTLSAGTTQNTWYANLRPTHTTHTHMKEALQRNNLIVRTKTTGPDVIGHNPTFSDLALELLKQGYVRWSSITTGHMISRFKVECCLGRSINNQEYEALISSACPPGTIKLKDSLHRAPTLPPPTKHRRRGALTTNEAESAIIHYPTKTIFAFTDGSCSEKGCGIGVFFGANSHRNRSASAFVAPTSTIAELLAIEEALKACPTNYNIHIITDSKTAINIISNYHKWPTSKQRKTIARPTVRRILALQKRLDTKYGIRTSFTHIPSHVEEKRSAAKRESPEALAKLESKIKDLEAMLPGKIETFFNGNEKADKLAKSGTDMPPIIQKWEIQNGADHATLFNNNGIPIEGCARKHVMKTRQLNRPGPPLTTTNLKLTRTVHCKTALASNFVYKTNNKLLPTKDSAHHLFWNSNPTTPKAIPKYAKTNRRDAHAWLVKQTLYADQKCPACNTKETQLHALSGQCPMTLVHRPLLTQNIQNVITKAATINSNHADRIPSWFDSPASPKLDVIVPHFEELEQYSHTLGKSGYVPTALPKALKYFGITGAKAEKTAVKLCRAVLTHHQDLWRKRCNLLHDPPILAQAKKRANEILGDIP